LETLEFTGHLPRKLGEGDCYALLRLGNWTPLVEAQQLQAEYWAIRVTEALLNEGKFRVPFRRRNATSDAREPYIGLRQFFYGPHGLFCNEVVEDIKVGGPMVGCIEPVPRLPDAPHRWVALLPTPPGSRFPKDSELQIFPEAIKFGAFKCILFKLKEGSLPKVVHILPSKYIIGNETVFMVLLKENIRPFFERGLSLYFQPVQSTGVEVDCGDKRWDLAAVKGDKNIFGGPIGCESSPRIAATTKDERVPFRIFNVTVKKATIFTFPGDHPEGFTYVRGTGQVFELGFKRQIIRNETHASVYKTSWDVPERTTFDVPGKVSVRYRDVDAATDSAEVFFEETQGLKRKLRIPWGVQKYVGAPAAYFEALKIPKTKPNYTGDVVNFTDNGTLVYAKGKFSHEKLKGLAISEFLDLNPRDVKGDVGIVQIVTHEGEDDVDVAGMPEGIADDMLLIIEVAAGGCVGILVVSLIALWIYRNRSKERVRGSSSSISGQSSSEGVVEEELIDEGH
jgi:hypothetical protein